MLVRIATFGGALPLGPIGEHGLCPPTVTRPARSPDGGPGRRRAAAGAPARLSPSARLPSAQAVTQPVDEPDARSCELVEQLRIRCSRVRPGRRQLLRGLNLGPELHE